MKTIRRTGLLAALMTLSLTVASCAGDMESAEGPAATQAESAPTAMLDVASDSGTAGSTTAIAAPVGAPAKATAPRPQSAPKAAAPASTPVVDSPPASEPEEDMPVAPAIEAGTSLAFAIEAELSTEKNKAGDMFSARLADDVLGADGQVLLPMGAVLRGRVTEALESPSADQPAIIRLAVDAIEANGTAYTVIGQVEEVALKTEARDSNRRTAATVAAGAGAGAVIGRIVRGNNRGTAAGAIAGAAAGAAVAVTTRDGQATIPVGALLTVRLTEALVIR